MSVLCVCENVQIDHQRAGRADEPDDTDDARQARRADGRQAAVEPGAAAADPAVQRDQATKHGTTNVEPGLARHAMNDPELLAYMDLS